MRFNFYKLIIGIILLSCAATSSAAITDYVLTPDPGGAVKSLSTIKIQFPEVKFLGMYGSSLGGVTLTKVDDPSTVYVPTQSSYSTLYNSNMQSFMLCMRDDAAKNPVEVTQPGRYVLHFPAKSFELCGSWYSNLGWSEEINVTYTIDHDGNIGFDDFLPENDIVVYPRPGDVQELNYVTLELPIDATEDYVTTPGVSLITLKRLGEDTEEYVVASCTYDLEKTIRLEFRPKNAKYPQAAPVSQPGEYVLTIPAGTINIPTTGKINAPMEIRYAVTGASSASFKNAVVTPASGILSQIDEISVYFPDLKGQFNFPEGVTDVTKYLNGTVTLTKLNEDDGFQKEYIPSSATLTGPRTVTFKFRRKASMSTNPQAEVIRLRGDYLLNIPPNTFKEKGDDFSFNGRIQAYYTIDRPEVDNPMDIYEITPTDGAQVGSLERISLTFPELVNGMNWPFDYSGIRITNVDDPEETYKALSVTMQSNTVNWGFNTLETVYDYTLTLTNPGTYRITIPAGILRDYTDSSHANPEIVTTFTVNPQLNFKYTLTPDPDTATDHLTEISMIGGGKSLRINPDAAVSPTLRSGSGTSYSITASQLNDNTLVFTLPQGLATGSWTLTVPARYLIQTNEEGAEVYNSSEINETYRIVTPTEYQWVFNPSSGSKMTGLPVVSLSPVGSGLRSVEIVDGVGLPMLSGEGVTVSPVVSVNDYAVVLTFPDDIVLAPGKYCLEVPEGLIRTRDNNGLPALSGKLTATYEIIEYEAPEISNGIFFLNEGWYGTDFGSINYLDENYQNMSYKVFQMANNGKGLGVTSQYADIFGDDIFIISKQMSYTDRQGQLTVADAETMKLKQQIGLGSASGRSLLCIDADKAYVGTANGIYPYDIENNMLQEAISETSSTSNAYSDQIGEMVRLGNVVYAVRQNMGVYVIDPETDEVEAQISIPDINTIFVTGAGQLYAATSNPSHAFICINTDNYSLTSIAIDNGDEATVEDVWGAWQKSPLATAVRGNAVYYATSKYAGTIARYDFDRQQFTRDFIKLPAQMALYGSAISVDPMSGYIVLQAVESKESINYRNNVIYFANPETGEIENDLTFYPEKHVCPLKIVDGLYKFNN